jgi:hypothetical protein
MVTRGFWIYAKAKFQTAAMLTLEWALRIVWIRR